MELTLAIWVNLQLSVTLRRERVPIAGALGAVDHDGLTIEDIRPAHAHAGRS
jgi:hypothetical protein